MARTPAHMHHALDRTLFSIADQVWDIRPKSLPAQAEPVPVAVVSCGRFNAPLMHISVRIYSIKTHNKASQLVTLATDLCNCTYSESCAQAKAFRFVTCIRTLKLSVWADSGATAPRQVPTARTNHQR